MKIGKSIKNCSFLNQALAWVFYNANVRIGHKAASKIVHSSRRTAEITGSALLGTSALSTVALLSLENDFENSFNVFI